MLPNRQSSTHPDWENQHITLYHGTLNNYVASILGEVILDCSKRHNEFGRGFYTTTVLKQARAWAISSAQRKGGSPAVVAFTLSRDDLAKLDSLWFVTGHNDSDDFWSFVYHCRNGCSDHGRKINEGWYDVVVGPVTVWPRRVLYPDYDQVSFHTSLAIDMLNSCKKAEV